MEYKSDRRAWAWLARLYRESALFFFNSVVAFAALNLMALLTLRIVGPESTIGPGEILMQNYAELVSSVYSEMAPEERRLLLTETWLRPYTYEPFTQFKERAWAGRYVNVDEAGFRHVPSQAGWPIDPRRYNIFLFGGSTIFNYGLPDDQTIASLLQAELRAENPAVAVYNFGRGGYYSTQERILFEQLLTSGAKPNLAVFLDGLNDFYYHDNQPQLTVVIGDLFAGKTSGVPSALLPGILDRMPLARLVRRWSGGYRSEISESLEPIVLSEKELRERYGEPKALERALENYLQNKRLIEAVAGMAQVSVLFFWQPTPTYCFSGDNYPFTNGQLGRHNFSRFGYPLAERAWRDGRFGENFQWIAETLSSVPSPLYVDLAHYSAGASRAIAGEMAAAIRQSSKPGWPDGRGATALDP